MAVTTAFGVLARNQNAAKPVRNGLSSPDSGRVGGDTTRTERIAKVASNHHSKFAIWVRCLDSAVAAAPSVAALPLLLWH